MEDILQELKLWLAGDDDRSSEDLITRAVQEIEQLRRENAELLNELADEDIPRWQKSEGKAEVLERREE